MTTTLAPSLPIARLHLLVRAEAALQLPPYAGSMLRGAFGHALLALAPLPHTDGQPCALHATCPYCQVFANPPLPAHSLQKFSQMPQPYVVEPPTGGAQRLQPGQTFSFGMVLIGRSLAQLPTIVLAWERALRMGLGVQQSRCTLLAVQQEGADTPLWHAGQASAPAPLRPLPPWPAAVALAGRATLHFDTPLRLQILGKPARAGAELTARTLLITLARRWQLLQDIHLGACAPQQDFAALTKQAQAVALYAPDMHWMDWGRYSQRQQQEMKLGGLLGPLQLQGELAPFAPLLHWGQWLHIGKNTSFGLGGYRLQVAHGQ